MRVALYARCSTADQNPDAHLHQLKEYSALRGLEVLEFVDHGVSGSKDRRPALDRLLDAARRREIDAVAVVKLDRLARSVRHLTQLASEFEALGVDLIVLDQGIDTSTPAGRLLFNVLGSIAEFEGDLIRERTRAGIAAARRRGKRLGRPRAPVALAKAQSLLASGLSVSAAARELGIARATLRRALLKNVSA